MGALTTVYDPAVLNTLKAVRKAFQSGSTKDVTVNGQVKTIPYPYPSPTDWRETWIYFLMTDRFNNPDAPPNSSNPDLLQGGPSIAWNEPYNYRQGGTFKGIEAQLDYISSLGAGAIWISPVLKNPKPDSPPDWPYNYHGYATQDFLTVDGRFASDGTEATAILELTELIEAAHARGLYIIIDIVINHAAEVFDYYYQNQVVESFSDAGILYGPLGDEPPIQWIDENGEARPDWQDSLPAGGPAAGGPSGDDAVWPADLQLHKDFFRRRGNKLSDAAPTGGFAKGDFGSMRQLVAEYDASAPGQQGLRSQYGVTPVLNILVQVYTYLVAAFDIDAFRIDTVKYVAPEMVETFGNAIREFALSIGKRNFFTFGEIYDDETTIGQFVGRNSTDANGDGFGIDAALDYPLFYTLPAVVKAFADTSTISQVFNNRKSAEEDLISSHGEAGKYFVSFLDNHDQNQRFNYPGTPSSQVLMGVALLFCLQGIPCLYYGTEQGLDGARDRAGNPATGTPESVREALWGKTPLAFDPQEPFYQQISLLGKLRKSEAALQYGRLYFREVSGNGSDFGPSQGIGGVLAFSRVLYDREILIVANTNTSLSFSGFAVMDIDINRSKPTLTVGYSNIGTGGSGTVQVIAGANFYEGGALVGSGETAAFYVKLAPMEIQIIIPEE
jgi:glycosidase